MNQRDAKYLMDVWNRTRTREIQRMVSWNRNFSVGSTAAMRANTMSEWEWQTAPPKAFTWKTLCDELPEAPDVLRRCIIVPEMADAIRQRFPSTQDYHAALDDESRTALVMAVGGYNVFITGSAGVGKSKIVACIVATLNAMFAHEERDLAVTGTTGVAAFNIGGTTIHSKMRLMDTVPARWHKVLDERMSTLNTLLVDEVSMLSVRDMYRVHVRMIDCLRQLKDQTLIDFGPVPLGGRQLIAVGDFFQLTDVKRKPSGVDRSQRERQNHLRDLSEFREFQPELSLFDVWERVFKTPLWAQTLRNVACLSKVKRQTDVPFIRFLEDIREGTVNQADAAFFLNGHTIQEQRVPESAMFLFSTNDEADQYNATRLVRLGGSEAHFHMIQACRLIDKDGLTREEHEGEVPKHRCSLTVRRGALARLWNNFSVENGITTGRACRIVGLVPITEASIGAADGTVPLAYEPYELMRKYSDLLVDKNGMAYNYHLLPGHGFDLAWSGDHGGVNLIMKSTGDSVYHEERKHPLQLDRSVSTVHKYVREDGMNKGTNLDYEESAENATRCFCLAVSFPHLPPTDVYVLSPIIRTRHEQRRGKNVAINSQLMMPLVLGWASTVHSAQGLSLDSVAISLRSILDNALMYVALSRAVASDSLYIVGDFPLHRNRPDPHVLDYYAEIKRSRTK